MTGRQADFPIDPLFLERWSPRAFDGGDMPHKDALTLFEAARWAPSAFNVQPWRFVYAHRGDEDWERLLGLLIPWNREWAQSASLIVYFLSDSLTQTKWAGEQVSHSHSFDCGAAWACFALQATRMGYRAHAMSGVDFDRAREGLGVPERFRIEAAAVVGRVGDPAILSEKLRAREVPSGRRPLDEIVFRGRFRD
jgi:nitroreductase